MAEILVKAVDASHANPEMDRRGTHKKGDIILVRPDGHPWGAKEGPPLFIRLRCPELTVDQIKDRNQAWRFQIAFQVTNSNLAQDAHRVVATNLTRSAGGAAGLTRANVQAYLERWNAEIVSVTAGSVTFDVVIREAIMSEAFWDTSLQGFTMTELAYTQQGGVHRIEADYSQHPRYLAKPASFSLRVARRITEVGGDVVSQEPGVIAFDVTRADVNERFRADVEERMGTYRRHRYHFAPSDVDLALGMGGVVDLTPAQIANRVLDRLAE